MPEELGLSFVDFFLPETLRELEDTDEITSVSAFELPGVLIYNRGSYCFKFRADDGLANITYQNRKMYLRLFFSIFTSHIVGKIQSEITSDNVHLEKDQAIPDAITQIAFVVLFCEQQIRCRPVIVGASMCVLQSIYVRTAWPGSKKIGEGTYGCIHAPSLMCENKTDPNLYINKISKIMEKSEMLTEMAQYAQIDKIDPDNKYHISAMSCTPKSGAYLQHSITKCNTLSQYEKKYELIVMDNGGDDLFRFCANKNKIWTEKEVCRMYVDALSLFKAVRLFVAHKFIHHDIKPHNVVYNASKREMKLIDFGLSDNARIIYDKIKSGNYEMLTNFHYNFPPELFLLQSNPDRYEYNKATDDSQFRKLLSTITSGHMHNDASAIAFVANSTLHFQNVINHTEPVNAIDCIRTIDSYGLGITMHYMYNKLPKFIGLELFYAELNVLIANLMCMDLRKRLLINIAASQYEQILSLLPSSSSQKRKRND